MLNNKFWQGFFALAPIIMVFILMMGYFAFLIMIMGRIEDQGGADDISASLILGNLAAILIYVLLLVVISFASLVYYIVHAVKNPNLKQNNLMLVWILLFIFANGIGQMIYWLVEIVGKTERVEV